MNDLSTPADPQQELEALKEALREKSEEIKRLQEKPVFGEWQLCPKCAGNGQVWNSVIPQCTINGWYLCDVCGGAKIIMRPIISNPTP